MPLRGQGRNQRAALESQRALPGFAVTFRGWARDQLLDVGAASDEIAKLGEPGVTDPKLAGEIRRASPVVIIEGPCVFNADADERPCERRLAEPRLELPDGVPNDAAEGRRQPTQGA